MRNPIRIVTVRNYRSNESWRRSVEKLNYSFDRRINCQTLDKLLFQRKRGTIREDGDDDNDNDANDDIDDDEMR